MPQRAERQRLQQVLRQVQLLQALLESGEGVLHDLSDDVPTQTELGERQPVQLVAHQLTDAVLLEVEPGQRAQRSQRSLRHVV